MEFVYKQKHVEDGIPAFRVNGLSCMSVFLSVMLRPVYRPFGFKGLI